MAPPLPTVAAQGQGSVGSDQLNTYVQTVQNFAQLRSFAALNDMSVQVLGGASEGDGSQGLFWYDASSTAPDDNATVIVPTGNTQGAWLLLPPGDQSPGNFASLSVSGNATFGGAVSIGGALTVTGVATFDADVLMIGTGEVQIPIGTTAQRSGAPAPGMIRYNLSLSQYEGYGASWQPLAGTGVAQPPNGRLTLTSGVPVLASAVIGATGLIWTPLNGNTVPQWNGLTWSSTPFAEISQVLSDATNSPAAAVANTIYDVFVWFKAGVATLSRGPAAGSTISHVQGFPVNTVAITNGPAAGYGLWVGRIATDTGGATVTYNPTPAAASGGPTGGAWIGLWNVFNRRLINAVVQDSKASWVYGTASWRASDSSNNNRVTFVVGQAEDSQTAIMSDVVATQPVIFGIGVNSTTTPSGTQGSASGAVVSTGGPNVSIQAAAGQNYFQMLELGTGSNATIYGVYSGSQVHGMLAQLWF